MTAINTITLGLNEREARGLLEHLEGCIRDGMDSRRHSCFWCGADTTERPHDGYCTMPLVLRLEARLRKAIEG